MADPDGYNRIVLKFVSPYSRRDTEDQMWSVKFSLSGEAWPSLADATGTAMALAEPILTLVNGGTSYVGYLAYAPGSEVNDYQQVYAAGEYPGTATAYPEPSEGHQTQLEVCALARAAVGVNSKGRAKYLFKHIHNIIEDSSTVGELLAVSGSPLATYSTGVGPRDLVTVDPSTGQASSAWTIHPALYTRQLRRGQKSPS